MCELRVLRPRKLEKIKKFLVCGKDERSGRSVCGGENLLHVVWDPKEAAYIIEDPEIMATQTEVGDLLLAVFRQK